MKSITDFIIHIDKPFNETFTTEQGMKLYGDKRWLADKMANRIAKVISVPLGSETPIKVGYEVLVDPSILYEQIYNLTHGVQESIFLVDKKKMWYKIQPNLVVLYRENENATWKGHLQNAVFERVEVKQIEAKTESSLIILPESNKVKQYEKSRARLVFGNDDLEVLPGQEVMVKDDYGLPFQLESKHYLWFRNEDIIAVVLN